MHFHQKLSWFLHEIWGKISEISSHNFRKFSCSTCNLRGEIWQHWNGVTFLREENDEMENITLRFGSFRKLFGQNSFPVIALGATVNNWVNYGVAIMNSQSYWVRLHPGSGFYTWMHWCIGALVHWCIGEVVKPEAITVVLTFAGCPGRVLHSVQLSDPNQSRVAARKKTENPIKYPS